jgi:SAM-dependent methyltransferase
MTITEFQDFGERIRKEIGSSTDLHKYFQGAALRLHFSSAKFALMGRSNLGRILEVGPFYGYLPFLLRNRAASYTIIEGPEPAVEALMPLYEQAKVEVHLLDFFEIFGPTRGAGHALPFPDNSFDLVICWETMEHFNFNPVKFVRELHRVCAPGAKVHVTVPNKTSFQALAGLLSRQKLPQSIKSYFDFENYQSDGKTAFYGFHWREYTPEELSALFREAGFQIERCETDIVFHHHASITAKRRILRFINKTIGRLFPRHGTNVFLTAVK